MVFHGFTVSYKVEICDNLGGFWLSFGEVFGYLGRHCGGLEGFWNHCKISMDFRTPPEATQILSRAGVEGDQCRFWGPLTAIPDR